jgi:hypothetical protein
MSVNGESFEQPGIVLFLPLCRISTAAKIVDGVEGDWVAAT